MKKVLNFIKKRSTILLLALLVIIIATFLILAGLFLPKMEGNTYGNRLNGIEEYPISDDLKNDILKSIEDTSITTSQTLTLTGKIIKIKIEVKDEVALDDAKKIYDSFKEKFTEDILSYYDIEIMINAKEYATFGYLKAGRTELKWTNNK